MKKHKLAVLALAATASVAQAQESNFSIVVGTKLWYADWTTWFVEINDVGRDVIQQVPAKAKLITIPQISVRYGDFIGSVSAALKSTHEFEEPGLRYRFERKEIDANVGYYLTPGLAASVGFKKFTQSQPGGGAFYEASGPTFGLSGSAQLAGGFSMYGALGLGPLKLKDFDGGGGKKVKATYSLSEVGLAYTMLAGRFIKAVSFTAGYRTQILAAKGLVLTDNNFQNAVKQDARDVTQGITLGIVAAF